MHIQMYFAGSWSWWQDSLDVWEMRSTAMAGDSPVLPGLAGTSYTLPLPSVAPGAGAVHWRQPRPSKAATLDNTGRAQPTQSCLHGAHTWSPWPGDHMSLMGWWGYLPRRRRDLGSSSLLKQRQDVSWDPCCHKTRVISTLAASSKHLFATFKWSPHSHVMMNLSQASQAVRAGYKWPGVSVVTSPDTRHWGVHCATF